MAQWPAAWFRLPTPVLTFRTLNNYFLILHHSHQSPRVKSEFLARLVLVLTRVVKRDYVDLLFTGVHDRRFISLSILLVMKNIVSHLFFIKGHKSVFYDPL